MRSPAQKSRRAMRMMRQFFLLFLGMVCSVAARAQAPLRIAAAADLEPVLPPILAQFQHLTGIHAEATYNASAMLTTQILNGAPFDVFLAADLDYPQRLIAADAAEGLNDAHAPGVYARGTLVLWERKGTHLPPPSLALLRSPQLQRLAIANPDRAPYGKAAVAALRSLKLYDTFAPRLATAENIAQAAQFADSGNADAGLISMTSALTPQLRADGDYFILPRDLYPPIEQGAVIVTRSPQQAAARRFLLFLLSEPVQAELARSGLTRAR
jgi:molybdate transport system substrate-binding protein